MTTFEQQIKDIWRLRVPFDTVYTSVFLIKTETDMILVDCATTADDVDTYIVPALSQLGISLQEVGTIVLTHRHTDHAGGLTRILDHAPNIEVVSDIRTLCDKISTYPMAGHTADCIGVLDKRTGTLISGDGLQGAGVDKYRCSLKAPEAYLETLLRIDIDQDIQNILFSHAYEPWYKDFALGRDKVKQCLEDCKAYVKI